MFTKIKEKNKEKPKLLLHVCCAPCSTHCVEVLKKEYDVTLFFYNPNIHPQFEYDKRLSDAKKISEKYDVGLIIGDYDYKEWIKAITGLFDEKEGGKRCEKCFEYRLFKSAQTAKELEMSLFTTTLSISPHKNFKHISKYGKKFGAEFGIEFLEKDFKKQDGFKKSRDLSKKLGLYRQKFCGCIFSYDDHIERENKKIEEEMEKRMKEQMNIE
ncbi:epoxyqueuosine reductase QueH [Candidatus Woesearchaeota archaeon]|jgi:epoxyqueuosine reductase|nr:epoxyqueuosine reductase QueH [Candidatus Woesearchaeota archaeon]MBT7367931.1 epoxyqueuosine reductase QueH [Candidatus Woesearchaeota archaeon]